MYYVCGRPTLNARRANWMCVMLCRVSFSSDMTNNYTLWVKKLDPFSFEDNFGKCCPILIILSPSQTEINYDQAHPKIICVWADNFCL